jgi:UDP-N-acetylmuramoylalanine--D-glutamate ligase
VELPSLDTRIGIWGFGRVGKSVAQALLHCGYQIAVMDSDRNILSDNLLNHHNVVPFTQDEHDRFFDYCSLVVPSPGIDLRPCIPHKHTWLSELDLFQALWKKPIIAITGSVGKTTVTSMLADICRHNGIEVALGGNIGTAACTLLATHPTAEYALLEVSSFQLELCRFFAPHIAIITNLYANHLDRHDSYEAYWQAKAQIFIRQRDHAILIAPYALRNRIDQIPSASKRYYTSTEKLEKKDFESSPHTTVVFDGIKNSVTVNKKRDYQTLAMPKSLLLQTLPENALICYASMYALTHNRVSTLSFEIDYVKHAHRLEVVSIKNGVTFVNDSKATTMASTLAAVEQYKNMPIILFLGGLGKGANREILIANLPTNVIHVICFGIEASTLASWCQLYNKPGTWYTTMPEAFTNALQWAQPGTILLFSPSGSSFDLYDNYEKRGDAFKQLVLSLPQKY